MAWVRELIQWQRKDDIELKQHDLHLSWNILFCGMFYLFLFYCWNNSCLKSLLTLLYLLYLYIFSVFCVLAFLVYNVYYTCCTPSLIQAPSFQHLFQIIQILLHSYDSNTQLKKASFHADLVPPTNHNWNQVRWTACRFPGLWPTLVANQIRSKNIILKILTSNHLQSMWAFLHSYSIFDHIFISTNCIWQKYVLSDNVKKTCALCL